MDDEGVLVGVLVDDSWLTLEQIAAACMVDIGWLVAHLEEGLFPQVVSVAGVWRFSAESVLRGRRMRQLERDFDAVPELAALIADLLEEADVLRSRLGNADLTNT